MNGSRVTVCDLKLLRNQFILNCYEFRMLTVISFISIKKLILKHKKNWMEIKKGTLGKDQTKLRPY